MNDTIKQMLGIRTCGFTWAYCDGNCKGCEKNAPTYVGTTTYPNGVTFQKTLNGGAIYFPPNYERNSKTTE